MRSDQARYQAALDLIDSRSDYARGYISRPSTQTGGPELGLTRTRALLDALGSPDRAYPIVHIAGTKGKGSTAAYTAAIGLAAGYRTGLSTSPHLHSFRERIALDGDQISYEAFGRIADIVRSTIDVLEQTRPELGSVTAFELLTVMALLAFAEATCELAVVEVGLGGTFDATNVVTPVVSVITRLDMEHTRILGNTIEAIAKNKAGIIKLGVPVVTAHQDVAALAVIEQRSRTLLAPLAVAGRHFHWLGDWRGFAWSNDRRRIDKLHTSMPGDHQMENASLSIAAWDAIASIGLPASDTSIRQGLEAAHLPGRFERVESGGRLWVVDGAHTPIAGSALSEAILAEFRQPVVVIVGMLQDKSPADFLAALKPSIAELIVTTPRSPRAMPAEELLLSAFAGGIQAIASVSLEDSVEMARARYSTETPVVITGSFALVSEARQRFGLALPDR